MKHRIDPKVDCVFKSIFGQEENKNLLIHFLNAVLGLEEGSRIVDVTIENPYDEKEFIGRRQICVEGKATDEKNDVFLIEIQSAMHSSMISGMLHTWSGVYCSQVEKNMSFANLKPLISIWIVDKDLFEDVEKYHFNFGISSPGMEANLTDDEIHVLLLPKFKTDTAITKEEHRWIYFFKEGRSIDYDNPPEVLETKEMKQAIEVLKRFSENQEKYLFYQRRVDALMEKKGSVQIH
ncbi:Rpn family recombination-promoting nuclease/putative transposase [Desulfobacterales bacterium HSG16]|nr:Rpn family recombination-promoting nuclease/putative transposase [Desulfobacterales bacterium HSG16]